MERLCQMITEHGGEFKSKQHNATHWVAENLQFAKIDKHIANKIVVNPRWITDSIKAQKR